MAAGTMSDPAPTLIFVHGSWHSPAHWEPLIQEIEHSYSLKCKAVALPSTQDPNTAPKSLTDDTNAIRNAVLSELESNDVIIIAHSYGGCPTNNALCNLDSTSRKSAGQTTSVKAIVFICAIPLPNGMTFLENLGGKPLPIHDLRTPGGEFARVGEPGPEYYFYNEMDPAEAKKWSEMLRPQAWKTVMEEQTTYEAYRDFECWYLACVRDQAFPIEKQKALVGAAKEKGARISMEMLDEADHTPFIGRNMHKTIDFIRRVVDQVSK